MNNDSTSIIVISAVFLIAGIAVIYPFISKNKTSTSGIKKENASEMERLIWLQENNNTLLKSIYLNIKFFFWLVIIAIFFYVLNIFLGGDLLP